MTTYGLTPTGFVVKPVAQILADIAADQTASPALGVDIDNDAESLLGQINGSMALRLGELWEALGVLYTARDPRAASFDALDSVCALTGVLRAAAEGDPVLRIRREAEIGTGASPVDALRAALLKVSGVVQVVVWENPTDIPTADGIPPHAVECMVLGGADADVALAVWQGKAGGIQPWGNTTATVTDAAGKPRTVRYTRPTTVPVYVQCAAQTDPRRYAGDVALRAALAADDGVPLLAGDSVQVDNLIVAAKGLPGLLNARLLIGTDPGTLGSADVTVGLRQVATLDPSRVSVVPW